MAKIKKYFLVGIDFKADTSGIEPFSDKFYDYTPTEGIYSVDIKEIDREAYWGNKEHCISQTSKIPCVVTGIYPKYRFTDQRDNHNDTIEDCIKRGGTATIDFEVFIETTEATVVNKEKYKKLKNELELSLVDYLNRSQPAQFTIRFSEKKKENPPEVTGLDIYVAMKCTTRHPNYVDYRKYVYSLST